jgi:hypothetical protein
MKKYTDDQIAWMRANLPPDQFAWVLRVRPDVDQLERLLAVCDLIDRGILRRETQPDGCGALLENTDDPEELAETDRVLGPRPSTH